MENETPIIPEETPVVTPTEPVEESVPEVQTSDEVAPEEVSDGLPPKSYVNQDGGTMHDDYRTQ